MPVLFFSAGGYGGFLGGLSRASGTITEFRPRFVCGGANAFRKLIFGGGCGNKPYGDSDISVKVFSGLPPFFPVRVSPRNTTLRWLHVLRRTFRGARGRDARRIYDPSMPFRQCEDADTCKFCDFNLICKR